MRQAAPGDVLSGKPLALAHLPTDSIAQVTCPQNGPLATRRHYFVVASVPATSASAPSPARTGNWL